VNIEPGGSSTCNQIAHSSEEFVYVLQGSLACLINGRMCDLDDGDNLLFLASQPHICQNRTMSAAQTLIIFQPLVGLVMSDGGAVYPYDAAKAFCGDTDFLMSGQFLSTFTQSGGELVEKDGLQFKQYYGMSSYAAMQSHYGGVAKHRASESREVLLPYKGNVNDFIVELFGSLRSTATYIGAMKLKEFSRRATFLLAKPAVKPVT